MPATSTYPTVPIFGSFLNLQTDRWLLLRDIVRVCGPIGQVMMEPVPVIVVSDQVLTTSMLVQHAASFGRSRRTRDQAHSFIDNGLLVSDQRGAHRRRPRLVGPALQPRHIETYAKTMTAYAEETVLGWQEGATIPVLDAMLSLTLRIMVRALFGIDIHAANARTLGSLIIDAIHFANHQMRMPIPLPLAWPPPWASAWATNDCSA